MKTPRQELLIELANALTEAQHLNVAQQLLAGLLWAIYPDWFTASGVGASK